MTEELKEGLLAIRKKQQENREFFGDGYNEEDADYIFVDMLGNLMKPNYVTGKFERLLKRHGLKKIRFHDLRHTVASLMVKHDVPMKFIQTWMGHSDFSTTANIYSHVDSDSSKDKMAEVMNGILNPAEKDEEAGGNEKS